MACLKYKEKVHMGSVEHAIVLGVWNVTHNRSVLSVD